MNVYPLATIAVDTFGANLVPRAIRVGFSRGRPWEQDWFGTVIAEVKIHCFIIMNIFLFLFCNIFTWTPALSFFTKAELQSYNVFVKPYGLDLVKLIPNVTSIASMFACVESHAELQACNNTSFNIISNTSSHDLVEMFEKCPTGQLGCFQNQTGPSFIRVLEHLDKVMKKMCSDQCWKKLALVSRTCILKNTTGFMLTAEKNALQFISEVLDATCQITSQSQTCAEKLIHRIIQNEGDPNEVCNVSSNLKAEPKKCSSACYKELQQFYKNLGCCVGSVREMIACYNISTKGDSFGAFVEDSFDLCHINPPKACKRVIKTQCPTMIPTVSTETNSKTSKTSHNAMKIAGICIGVLVITLVLLILGRFIYQRIKRKEKLHLEDYGYSRLKMMEDDLYNDFTDDSDFEGFVAM